MTHQLRKSADDFSESDADAYGDGTAKRSRLSLFFMRVAAALGHTSSCVELRIRAYIKEEAGHARAISILTKRIIELEALGDRPSSRIAAMELNRHHKLLSDVSTRKVHLQKKVSDMASTRDELEHMRLMRRVIRSQMKSLEDPEKVRAELDEAAREEAQLQASMGAINAVAADNAVLARAEANRANSSNYLAFQEENTVADSVIAMVLGGGAPRVALPGERAQGGRAALDSAV